MTPTKISPFELLQYLNYSVCEACDFYHMQRSEVDGIPLVNVLVSKPLVVGGVVGIQEER